MTDNSQPPEDAKNSGQGTSSASAGSPTQAPLNLITPVTVHDRWEDSYEKEESQDPKTVDYKEYADGSIVISRESLEILQRKLNAASKLKKRHLKVLKVHEQLLEEHELLLLEREKESRQQTKELVPVPQVTVAAGSMAKATERMDKILRALAKCKWHEFKRRKELMIAMKKTLNYMKRRT